MISCSIDVLFGEVKDAAVHIDYEDDFALIEHTVVHPVLSKYYFFWSLVEVLVPHPIYFPLPIEVLKELKDVCCPSSSFGLDTLGNLHVYY